MFFEDQDIVLYDTANFYRELEEKWTIILDTIVSAQRVHNQLNYIETQKDNLNSVFKGTGIESLLERKKKTLEVVVGKSYESIRQYMIIKTNSVEEINRFEVKLNHAVNNTAYLKDARLIDNAEEIYQYFLGVFGTYDQ